VTESMQGGTELVGYGKRASFAACSMRDMKTKRQVKRGIAGKRGIFGSMDFVS